MKRVPEILFLAVIGAATACGTQDQAPAADSTNAVAASETTAALGATKAQASGDINVNGQCSDIETVINIGPLSKGVNKKDVQTVTWRKAAKFDSIAVAPHAGGTWPPRKTSTGDIAEPIDTVPPGTYPYSLTIDCTTRSGATQHIVIDPDVVIDDTKADTTKTQ